jgi:hypothetical protein
MAMDSSAADSYVYAKASGMLASSYVGRRALKLFSVRTLHELWALVCDSEVPAVPEAILAKMLEVEARDRFVESYKKLISNYANPAPVLVSLVHFYDYDNIKELGAALCFKEHDIPPVVDTKPFNLIQYEKWPDIKAMTSSSVLSWYDHVPELSEQQANDYRLDVQYLQELWTNVEKTDASCRGELKRLLLEKIRMENILWALRLKLYYNMNAEEIREHLAYSSERKVANDVFASEALKILNWDINNYDQWQKWKYARYLNPHEEGVVWTVDPRWISNAHKKEYVAHALRSFHSFPFTECPLVCWFIVKRNELDAIRTVSEGIRMNVSMKSAMQVAGVTEESNG